MSYSVNAKGTKDEVQDAIRAGVGENHAKARSGLIDLVQDQKGVHVVLVASGSDYGSSVKVTSGDAPAETSKGKDKSGE